MIHQVTINDNTSEGKLILEVIKAMKPSKKSVKISTSFDYKRLVVAGTEAPTEAEMEQLIDEAENSKGISLNAFRKKMEKKIAVAHANRIKKAS